MGEKKLSPENRSSILQRSDNGVFDIIALAASAGGLKALSQVLAALPADFPASIVVVQHLDPRYRSLMSEILSRRTALQVKQAEEGDHLTAGTVYIAPPNRHLLVNPVSTLSLSHRHWCTSCVPRRTCCSNRWRLVIRIALSQSFFPAQAAMAPWELRRSRRWAAG